MINAPCISVIFIFLIALSFRPGDAAAQQEGNSGVDYEFPSEPLIQDPLYAKKEQQLFDAIKKEPDNPSWLIQLARLYQVSRYYDKAIAVLNDAIAKHPSNSQAHYFLGQILGSQQRNPTRSIEELHEAIRLQPNRIEYRQELVAVYYRLQRFPPALEQIEEILQREPDNIMALYRKAVILHIQGVIPEAESILDRMPNDEHARVLKAIIVQQRGENAKPLFESILKDYPTNLRARYEYGKAILREKKVAEAQKIFEEIINEDPFYQHAQFQLIKLYSLQKEKQKAALAKQSLDTINRMGRKERNFYRSYLRHHPDTAETHYSMGLIYLEIGRGNLAEEEFLKTLSMDANHQEARFYLAQIQMASGNFDRALPYLQALLSQQPQSSRLYALIAQCYLEMKDSANAAQSLRKSLEINPQDPLANRIRELWSRRSIQSATNPN
ncbi:MAG: tetratricopeptide repeat protein [Candidatus Omnitrophota bacterium]